MNRKKNYWEGEHPSGLNRWQEADFGTILNLDVVSNGLLKMYRRHVNVWNEFELENSVMSIEQAARISGAKVVGSPKQFILNHYNEESDSLWILEIFFSRNFDRYTNGRLNAMKSQGDIFRAILHWRGSGRGEFDSWLERASQATQ